MKVLITGGFGFLGGRLAELLAEDSNYEVFAGTRHPESTVGKCRVNMKVIGLNWNNSAELENACKGMDAIIHAAGMNARECSRDPVAALKFNGGKSAELLYSSIGCKVKRFIYISSAHVYGSGHYEPINETTCPINLHPYATSHRAAEDLVRFASSNSEIEGVVVRLSNSFGRPLHKDVNCWELVVNDLCRQAITTGKLELCSSGSQSRDFIPMTEACEAIKHLLELPAAQLGDGLFNVGHGQSQTILKITRTIAERINSVAGYTPEIFRKTDKQIESEKLIYDVSKLNKTGFGTGDDFMLVQEIDSLIRFCINNFK